MNIFGSLSEISNLIFRRATGSKQVTVKPNEVTDTRDTIFQLPDLTANTVAIVQDTLAGVDSKQTLTNKTLTSPVLTGGNLNGVTLDTTSFLDTKSVPSVTAATTQVEARSNLVPPTGSKAVLVTRDTNGDVGTSTSNLGINNLYVNNLVTAGTITGTVSGTAELAKDLDGSLPNGLLVSKGGTGNKTLTSNGILYGQGTGSIGATSAGTQYQVLQAGAGGTPTFGALDLSQSAATTNSLPTSKGGTGLNTTPTNGQLPIGNGTGYTLSTLTAGTGISITNSAGSISLSATGFSGSLAGDVSGTQSATSVDRIKGKAVSGTAPTDAQDLVWNATSSQWVPVSFSGDVTRVNTGAATVANVGGKTAAQVASAVTTVAAATNLATASTLAQRTAYGAASFEQAQLDGTQRMGFLRDDQSIQGDYSLNAANSPVIRIVTGAGITQLNTIFNPYTGLIQAGKVNCSYLILINESGSDITVGNDGGSPSTNGIYTGTGSAYTFKNQAAISLIYEPSFSGGRWVIAGGAGGSAGGTTDTVIQATSFAVGDLLYYNGSGYTKAVASAANTAEVVGIVSKVVAAGTQYEVTLSGTVSGILASNFSEAALPTAGTVVFLSPAAASAGKMTVSEPNTLGQVSVPVGVYLGSGKMYFLPKRGAVVGGTNARTQLNLASNASTPIFNAQTPTLYQAGELTGWVQLGTSQKFYFRAPFAQNGAGTDWNISPSYVGDTPPTGFSITMSSAGAISATCPTFSGTGLINYALNAPAVGATFPLAVDASTITTGTIASARLPAGQYPGSTSGTAIATGYVGEASSVVSWSVTTTGTSNLATLPLNKGTWLVLASGSAITAGFRCNLSISTTSATEDAGSTVTTTGFTGNQPTGQTCFRFLTISADNTPVYAIGRMLDGSTAVAGRIQAVRIA